MRLTVAIPPLYRNILEAALAPELARAVDWSERAPADVVLALEGEGTLVHCPVWPGVEAALALLRAGHDRLRDRHALDRLHEVGNALGSEQDLGKLLDLILTHGRKLVQAEAGSIYLIVEVEGRRELQFAHTQNARVALPYHRFQVPISRASMAGYTALTGEIINLSDAYDLPSDTPYTFNDAFDLQAGYRTVSMLVVPLQDAHGEILGVLQFINRLEESGLAPEPGAFPPEHVRLALSLAGQAGAAIKNVALREDIERLFEGFVNAAVTAIEQRDPVTSGHSGRVAALTVGLAEAVNRAGGPFAQVHFTDRQLRELRYASLLHDFGKVGVREQVLGKCKKLEPPRLELLLQRLRQREEEELLETLRREWESGRPFDPALWRAQLQVRREEGERLMAILRQGNEPTVLTQDVAGGLDHLEGLTYGRWDGAREGVLSPEDLASLRVRKGSLSEAERLEMESHVTHTYRFLSRIPWTADLAQVPDIAYAHHERLNGLGYPRRLEGAAIPLQSRAMAISDIFDALTAQDRPYKAALPLERSLSILSMEAQDGNLDRALLDLFIEARVFERTVPSSGSNRDLA